MAIKDLVQVDVAVVLCGLEMYEKSLLRRVNAETDSDALKIWNIKLSAVREVKVKVMK